MDEQPAAAPLSAGAAFRRQLRDNPVIWVMFVGFALLTIPIQTLNPLREPYADADGYAQIIATLLVALAFDSRLDIAWLVPSNSAEEARDRNEVVAAITLALMVLIAVGLLTAIFLNGWTEGDDQVTPILTYLPIAAVAAELFMLMAAFYLKASNPKADD
ncbi:MAG: hypothetical protein QM648_11640 [Solirubrobacterales bacterium]